MLLGNLVTMRDSTHCSHLIGQFVDLLASDWLSEPQLSQEAGSASWAVTRRYMVSSNFPLSEQYRDVRPTQVWSDWLTSSGRSVTNCIKISSIQNDTRHERPEWYGRGHGCTAGDGGDFGVSSHLLLPHALYQRTVEVSILFYKNPDSNLSYLTILASYS